MLNDLLQIPAEARTHHVATSHGPLLPQPISIKPDQLVHFSHPQARRFLQYKAVGSREKLKGQFQLSNTVRWMESFFQTFYGKPEDSQFQSQTKFGFPLKRDGLSLFRTYPSSLG